MKNKELLTPDFYAYHYDLEKIKEYVIKNWGIWEMDEPPTGLVVYLSGTVVHIGNDYPYIDFEGDIEIARKIHQVGLSLVRRIKMSKELEAFRIMVRDNNLELPYSNTIQAIETALKNYEELTSKPVILYGRTHGYTQSLIDYVCKNYKEVKITNLDDEKKLKAFEIIKDKKIDMGLLNETPNVEEYNNWCSDEAQLIPEEFDLLKEKLL